MANKFPMNSRSGNSSLKNLQQLLQPTMMQSEAPLHKSQNDTDADGIVGQGLAKRALVDDI